MVEGIRPKFKLNVVSEFFEKVGVKGTKKYELRINSGDRPQMQAGDLVNLLEIDENKQETGRYVIFEISKKVEAPTFRQIAEQIPMEELGFEGKTPDELEATMLAPTGFYPRELEAQFGAVAIGIGRILEKNLEPIKQMQKVK